MPTVLDVWKNPLFGKIGARAYDAVLERPSVARPAGTVLWGCDTAPMYAAMDVVNEMPDGAAVLDVPVGGGVVLGRLDPAKNVRYVAADVSSEQLAAARRVAERRGLGAIEYIRSDATTLAPFADGEFDLVVTFAGLHCMPDPEAAVASMGRVLAPGGRLVGSCIVTGAGARYDVLVRTLGAIAVFGPSGSKDELRNWLGAAGLSRIELSCNGALAQFTAVKR